MIALPAAPQRPAVIEVIGPAGAGKSAVVACLARRDRIITGSAWRTPFPLLAWGTARALPGYLRLVRRAGAPLWREFKHLARLRALDPFLERRALDGFQLLALDEGPVFLLTWLRVMGHPVFSDGRSASWWQYWLGIWASELDAVVRLDAPDDVLAERLRTRSKQHVMQGQSNGHIAEFSARFRTGFDQVIAGLQVRGRVPVLEFQTHRDPPACVAERILQALPRNGHD